MLFLSDDVLLLLLLLLLLKNDDVECLFFLPRSKSLPTLRITLLDDDDDDDDDGRAMAARDGRRILLLLLLLLLWHMRHVALALSSSAVASSPQGSETPPLWLGRRSSWASSMVGRCCFYLS